MTAPAACWREPCSPGMVVMRERSQNDAQALPCRVLAVGPYPLATAGGLIEVGRRPRHGPQLEPGAADRPLAAGRLGARARRRWRVPGGAPAGGRMALAHHTGGLRQARVSHPRAGRSPALRGEGSRRGRGDRARRAADMLPRGPQPAQVSRHQHFYQQPRRRAGRLGFSFEGRCRQMPAPFNHRTPAGGRSRRTLPCRPRISCRRRRRSGRRRSWRYRTGLHKSD